MTSVLKINPADNVAVAIVAQKAGSIIQVEGKETVLLEDIPAGHKIALKDFSAGENVIKYGYPIGHVTCDVRKGSWLNEHNIKTNLAGLLEYSYHPTSPEIDLPKQNLTFKGYRRPDRRLRQRDCQPIGREITPGNSRKRRRCHCRISAQLWLFAVGR